MMDMSQQKYISARHATRSKCSAVQTYIYIHIHTIKNIIYK
jgi:hypothetical protein